MNFLDITLISIVASIIYSIYILLELDDMDNIKKRIRILLSVLTSVLISFFYTYIATDGTVVFRFLLSFSFSILSILAIALITGLLIITVDSLF